MIGSKTAIALLASGVILCSGAQVFAGSKGEKAMTTEKEKISYALGHNIGQNLKRDVEVDLDSFFRGIKDSQDGKSAISDEEMEKTMTAFQNQMREKQMAQMKKDAEGNKVAGEAFLKDNKTKEGVITLPSGLQYKIITKGNGAKPTAAQKVKCHYKGTTVDGKEFDSSYKRGEPATFQVGGVIKGWTEALQLMPVGSKWMLYIPSDLAYGDRGAGRAIAPGSSLIFEVELLGIE